ncbi:LIM DOMAIN-CONTAINING PROTEIN [Encephalitozoon cuniculi GB-M1]|uniref:LIM DOMAIN-CONTAINING PROTEIN n=2 Tax=Encephalitozoon cuniculi TaxID=6035 RepID=Q8SQZ0_ENCCU|nr:zinc finger domain-containing protein [Encephalitozoon cuniculi GB-M1]KMV64989.1 zinc finger domain-containing protein [Encephalitozoon cuniculi EcunIII-L]UYI26231.1 CHY zinc finger [Encephalitozoon cuniculi]CAD25944.2 LIM DOMAIN-CONTAINING PROTEIN [Encephalitozoon cuniculi GB-M1]
MSCEHYSNNCLVRFECCSSLYPCRLCHDKAEAHRANRYEVSQIVCGTCNLLQPKTQTCLQCLAAVSKYFCSKCNLWDSSDDQIFHCDGCNVCRRGDPKSSFHCDICQTCLVTRGPRDHTHVENTASGNCPICAEEMSESMEVLVLLRCGHSLHERCFNEFIKETYTCPMCSKPIGDTSIINRKVECLLGMEPPSPEQSPKNIAKCTNCNNLSKCGAIQNKCPFCGLRGVVDAAQEKNVKSQCLKPEE